MATPTTTDAAAALARLGRLRDRYAGLSRLQRELVIFGVALLVGLTVMPFLIWYAGSHVLGPYTHGANPHAGPFALFADFLVGLWHGSGTFWSVALGPAVLLTLTRLLIALLRSLPSPRGASRDPDGD